MRRTWRAVKEWALALAVVLGLWGQVALGATAASGTVFWDADGDGLREAGEPGAAGVRLTAGYAVAVTDAEGAYSIRTDEPFRVVSVSFVSGSWPTAGWFRRVEGERAEGVDFGLRRREQRLPFAFVQMTDPHGYHAQTLPQVLAECRGLPLAPSFCVCTGDMRSGSPTVRDLPDLERTFGSIGRTFEGFGFPLFMVPGNHDTVGFDWGQPSPLPADRTTHPLFGDGCWERYVCPSHWSFSCGGVHFVGLPYAGYVNGHWDTLPPRTERWLREDLEAAAGERVMLFAHNPALGRLIEQYHIELGLFGDAHTEGPYVRVGSEKVEFGPRALVGGMCQAPTDPKTGARRYDATGRPMGYRIVIVDRDGVDTFFKALGEPHTIMVTGPRRFQAARTEGGALLAGQFFDPQGGVTGVRVSVAGVPHDVTVTRGPLWGGFEAPLGHPGLTDGFHDVSVAVLYPEGGYSVTEPYLILTGTPGALRGPLACRLVGRAERMPREAGLVTVDDRPVPAAWSLADGTAEAPLSLGGPDPLIAIGVEPGKDGRPLLHDVHLTGDDGRVYYDQHRAFGWGFGSDLEPGRRLYFDLLYPGPPVRWRLEGPAIAEPAGDGGGSDGGRLRLR